MGAVTQRIRAALAASVLLVAFPAAGADDREAQVQAEVDRARALVAAGDPSAAVAALRDAEKRLGESAVLRLETARAFLAQAERTLACGGDAFSVRALVADANLRWKQAVALDPAVPGAVVLRARILCSEEDPAAAKTLLREHVAQAPRDAEAWSLLGEMASEAREWEAADDAWTKAAVLDPKDGRARLEATRARQWLGAYAADLERGYLEACRLLPEDDRALHLLVGVHPKDPEKRLALLRRVVELQPRAVAARVRIADHLRTEGTPRPDEALAVLREAAAIAPDASAVHQRLGEILEERGELDEAFREHLRAVETGRPGEVTAPSKALDRMLHVDASPKGVPLTLRIRAYEALCTKNPSDGSYGNNAGFWFRDVGKDYEASLRWYLRSVEAEPEDQDFLNDTGLLFLFHLTDRKDQCLPYFQKVLQAVEDDERAPERGYWDALENLCKYWFERGDHRKVIAYAKKRADPRATLGGKPYPSARAAAYRSQSERALRDGK